MTTANLAVADNETVVQYESTGEDEFDYPFPILSSDELKVSVDQVVKTLGVDYTLDGIGDAAGGTVTFNSATTAGQLVTLWLDMPIKRLTGFTLGAATLMPEALNTEFVRQVRVDQMLRRDIARTLRTPIDDPQSGQNLQLPNAADRRGRYLRFADTATANPEVAEQLEAGSTLSRDGIGAYLYPILTGIEDPDTVTDRGYVWGHIKRYGALVDGSTDDTAAWQAATDQCALGGPPVIHPAGVSRAALINYRPGVTYQLGANAVVKNLDDTNNFLGRVFTTAQGVAAWDSAEDSAPVVWVGGIIDGNKDEQGAYTGGTKEHNAAIFLGAADGGGRLVARIYGTRTQNTTGDGIQVHSNVDVTIENIEAYKCWRSGVAITGAYVKVRGNNWRLYGDSTDRSDFDIEVDGQNVSYNNLEAIDVELSNIDVEHGTFEVSTASATQTSGNSRIFISNLNHRGPSCNVHSRGAKVVISNSVITFGPIDGSVNRIIWPSNLTFDTVQFIFSGGTGSSSFGVDIWPNTGGTTDTGQLLTFKNCRWSVDSTIQSGDTVYGVWPRTTPAANDNKIIVDGGTFDAGLDIAVGLTAGGRVMIKNSPTVECPIFLFLTYSSTNYYDVQVYGSPILGSGVTTYCRMNQGISNNTLTHYNTLMDEAFNVFDTTAGGNPQNNVHRGIRQIMVASAPTAATHGNVGDRCVIKTPAAAGVVEYVCTTRGWGSGAVWKALTTAAA